MCCGGSYRQAGFTLIEVVVGFMITAAAAASMFYGMTYARAQIRQTAIQERALEELVSYLDFWRARIADGAFTDPDMNPDTQTGKEVVLFDPENDPTYHYGLPQDVITGTIYREEIEEEPSPLNSNKQYYTIEAWITWEDHLGSTEADNEPPPEIRMTVSAFRFR